MKKVITTEVKERPIRITGSSGNYIEILRERTINNTYYECKKQGYRFQVRGGNYRLMRLLWHIISWMSERKCWDKVTGINYYNDEVDTYYLIRLGRRYL